MVFDGPSIMGSRVTVRGVANNFLCYFIVGQSGRWSVGGSAAKGYQRPYIRRRYTPVHAYVVLKSGHPLSSDRVIGPCDAQFCT